MTPTPNKLQIRMRKARPLLLGWAAAFSLPGVASAAPETDDRRFTSVWIIAPAEALQTGSRIVGDNEFVLKQRLLPPSLIRLRSAAVDRSGEVVVPAGTQLYGLVTAGPPIYCLVGTRDPSFLQEALLGGGNRQICLTDLDRDGALDARFTVGNLVKGLPNISGKRPKTPRPIRPAAFDMLEPEHVEVDYFAGVRFDGFVGILKRRETPTFSIVFGTEQSNDRLTRDVRPEKGSDPWRVRVLGGEFTVLQQEKDRIHVDVQQTLPPQPFGVVQTTTIVTY